MYRIFCILFDRDLLAKEFLTQYDDCVSMQLTSTLECYHFKELTVEKNTIWLIFLIERPAIAETCDIDSGLDPLFS